MYLSPGLVLTGLEPILIFPDKFAVGSCRSFLAVKSRFGAPSIVHRGVQPGSTFLAGGFVKNKKQEDENKAAAEDARAAAGSKPAERLAAKMEELTAELEKARAEAQEAHDKLLRMAADFENQKKRLQRDKEIALKFAVESLIKELLPSLDNLDRALNQDRSGENFSALLLEGVEMTFKGLMSTLEKFGLRPLQSVGQPFDPNFHEALALEASSEVPEQLVIQEYEKGYLLKDRLLRAAKVVVSKGNNDGDRQAVDGRERHKSTYLNRIKD
jgi:molecular chaperone GrpE